MARETPRRNRKAYEADLGRLNDAIWRFTNHANREVVTAVDMVCEGRAMKDIERAAEEHNEEARRAWNEAAAIAKTIWSDVRQQARGRA